MSKENYKNQIIVALISLIGVLGAAVITNWEKFDSSSKKILPSNKELIAELNTSREENQVLRSRIDQLRDKIGNLNSKFEELKKNSNNYTMKASKTYNRAYKGNGVVVPGWKCIGDKYLIEIQLEEKKFEAIFLRLDGKKTKSKFHVSGYIDAIGRLLPTENEAEGKSPFFTARIFNDLIIGSFGAYSESTQCVLTFELSGQNISS